MSPEDDVALVIDAQGTHLVAGPALRRHFDQIRDADLDILEPAPFVRRFRNRINVGTYGGYSDSIPDEVIERHLKHAERQEQAQRRRAEVARAVLAYRRQERAE